MKPALLFFLYFFLCITSAGSAQHPKIVGYLPHYRFQHLDDIQFEKLTHLCIAFANPDMDGNLSAGSAEVLPVVRRAHQHGVEVYISLAGGYLQSDWWAAWQHLTSTEQRSLFIHKIIAYVTENEFDGVDLDLEWQYVKPWYNPFALELNDSLKAYDKGFTAALPGTYRYPDITDEVLHNFDFINLMAYDLTGPWDPANPGPHSPYSFAKNSIYYWKHLQGIPGDNLTLGIPFYGYEFAADGTVTAHTYRSIIERNTANALRDRDGNTYYNGIPTVRLKSELAIREVGGVMVWELGQDDFGVFSLLNAIHETVHPVVSTAQITVSDMDIQIYPNPFISTLTIAHNHPEILSLELLDINGKIIRSATSNTTQYEWDCSSLPSGFYFLRIYSPTASSVVKLIKG